MTSRTGGLINCWRGLIVWNPFISKFHQDPSFYGDHPLSSSTIDSPTPVASHCLRRAWGARPPHQHTPWCPWCRPGESRRTAALLGMIMSHMPLCRVIGPAAHIVPRRAVPGARCWLAFSHRALDPTPLAACAERGVRWSVPSWRWEAVMERCFPVMEPSMTKSSGSHWKMELQNQEVLPVLVRSRRAHLWLKAIR